MNYPGSPEDELERQIRELQRLAGTRPYMGDEVRTTTRVERRDLASAAVPEGVTIKANRAGAADRDRVVAHLEDAAAKGYIGPDEAGQRTQMARDADSKELLTVLISDLPATPGNRAGDTDREKVTGHIGNMCAAGYITPEERDKRCAAALASVTKDELAPLTADLPPFPLPKRQPKPAEKQKTLKERLSENTAETGIAIGLCLITGMAMAICPWLAASGTVANALAAAGTICGAAIIIGSLIWASQAFGWE